VRKYGNLSSGADWSDFYRNLDEALTETHKRLPLVQRRAFLQDFCEKFSDFINSTAAAVDTFGGRQVWTDVKPFWDVLKRSIDERSRSISDPSNNRAVLDFLGWVAEEGDPSFVEIIDRIREGYSHRPDIVRRADEAIRRIRERASVQGMVDILIGKVDGDLLASARQLTELGIMMRDGCETRGTIEAAARKRLAEVDLVRIAERLLHKSPAVRATIALALGEWAGGETIDGLRSALRSDDDERVQLRCIRALRNIGGPSVAHELCEWLQPHTPGPLRKASVLALSELGCGSTTIYTEPPSPQRISAPKAAGATTLGEILEILQTSAEQYSSGPFRRCLEQVIRELREQLGLMGDIPL
jgi:hypothetical protein